MGVGLNTYMDTARREDLLELLKETEPEEEETENELWNKLKLLL